MPDQKGNLSSAMALDRICDEFEDSWRPDRTSDFAKFLNQVDPAKRSSLCKMLIEIDIELRMEAGQTLKPADYQKLGKAMVAFAQTAIGRIASEQARGSLQTPNRLIANDTHSEAMGTSVGQGDEPTRKPTTEVIPTSFPFSIGNYTVEKLLGRGGMGAVYLGTDKVLQRKVAIKVPKSSSSRILGKRFLREAKSAAALQHPNICPIYEFGEHEGCPFIVMAFIEGRPLSEFLHNRMPGQRQSAIVIRKIALALHEAHSNGIIHRDLKPANIMINARKEPVVMDFGLARWEDGEDSKWTHTGQFVGTPAYASPEQVRNEGPVGASTDIYSLGAILFQMLTGELPFSGRSFTAVLANILTSDLPSPINLNPEIDPELNEICLRALAREPENRFASANDFANALAQFLTKPKTTSAAAKSSNESATITGLQLDNSQPKPAPAQPRPKNQYIALRAILGIVVVLLVFCIGWVVKFGSPFGKSSSAQTEVNQQQAGDKVVQGTVYTQFVLDANERAHLELRIDGQPIEWGSDEWTQLTNEGLGIEIGEHSLTLTDRRTDPKFKDLVKPFRIKESTITRLEVIPELVEVANKDDVVKNGEEGKKEDDQKTNSQTSGNSGKGYQSKPLPKLVVNSVNVGNGNANQSKPEKISLLGKPVPDFRLKDIRSENVISSDLKGNVILLMFFNPSQANFDLTAENKINSKLNEKLKGSYFEFYSGDKPPKEIQDEIDAFKKSIGVPMSGGSSGTKTNSNDPLESAKEYDNRPLAIVEVVAGSFDGRREEQGNWKTIEDFSKMLTRKLNVTEFPTVVLVDHKGIVRFWGDAISKAQVEKYVAIAEADGARGGLDHAKIGEITDPESGGSEEVFFSSYADGQAEFRTLRKREPKQSELIKLPWRKLTPAQQEFAAHQRLVHEGDYRIAERYPTFGFDKPITFEIDGQSPIVGTFIYTDKGHTVIWDQDGKEFRLDRDMLSEKTKESLKDEIRRRSKE